MNYVKRQPAYLPSLLNSILNDTIVRDFDNAFNTPIWRSLPATNVVETPLSYQIDVMAPGFNKEDFMVNIEKNVLIIEGKHEATNENKDAKHLRHEYHLNSFKRQYTLPEDTEEINIKAEYTNGVLRITLPKKVKTDIQTTKTITIA